MEELANQTSPNRDEVHLLDYLIILAKNSRLIIYTAAAVTVLTYLTLFLLPNKYTATARLLPPQQNLTMIAQTMEGLGAGMGGGRSGGGAGGVPGGLLGLKTPADLYVGMLTCNTISDRIIERFKLREHYGQKFLEDLRKKLAQRVKISAGKDGLITIDVTDESPQRAQEMANAYINELDGLLHNLSSQEANDRLVYLDKKRTETAHKLSKAEESLRKFSENSGVLQIDAQTRGMLEYIASLRASIDAKEVQLKVLREQATPFNYDLIKLETEVKGLKEKLSEAEAQESKHPKTNDVLIASSKMPALGLEFLRLYREAKFQEQLYQLYSKLVELARLDLLSDFSLVQVVDRAIPPEKHSNKRLLPALLAGAGACLLMIFLSFALENWHNAAQSPEDFERQEELKRYLRPWVSKVKRLFFFRHSYKS